MIKRLLKETEEEAKFNSDFRDADIQFTPLVSGHYHELIMELVRQFCDEAAYESSDVFELYYRLTELCNNKFYAAVASQDKQGLGDKFQPFIYGWIKETKNNFQRIAAEAVERDQCTMIDSEKTNNSASLFEVFETLSNSLEFLKSLGLNHPFVIIQFTEIICNATEKFFNITSDKANAIIKNMAPGDYAPPITIYVLMNNLESAREKLDGLTEELEEELQASNGRAAKTTANGLTYDILKQTFDDCSRNAFSTSRTTLDNLINLASEQMNGFVRNTIESAIAASSQNVPTITKQLKQFAEVQLQQMMDNLQHKIFVKMAKRMWSLIVSDLHAIAAARKQDISQSQIRQTLPILEDILSQFLMKGKGLPKSYLDETAAPVRRLLEMWTQPSSALISMWWKLKEPMTSEPITFSSNHQAGNNSPGMRREKTSITEQDVMGILERRSDSLEARVFVEE